MEKLMTWALRQAGTVLLVTALATLLATSQLPRLQIAISPQSLIIEGDPDQAFYHDTLKEFGSDRVTIVYIQDPALFEPVRLEAIREVVKSLEALPFVVRTRSLFNVAHLRVRGDQVLTGNYLDQPPRDAAEARRLVEEALKNPFLHRNLLSEDGQAIAINLYIEDAGDRPDTGYDQALADAIEARIRPLRGRVERVFQIGLPYVRSDLARAVSEQQLQLIVGAFFLLLLILLLVFRRFSAVLIPMLTASVSVIWLLAAMAILEIPLNVLTVIVPVLMIIIGSTEDVHLLALYYRNAGQGYRRLRAIRLMNRRMALAIGLTFLTSYLGFLAVAANPIELVRNFGLVASSGLAINFLLTAMLVPALLSFLGETRQPRQSSRLLRLYKHLSAGIGGIILRYRHTCLVAVAALSLASLLAASRLEVNNSILNYLAPDSPIHKQIDHLRTRLAGLYTLQVVLDGHLDEAFERVRYLEEIWAIQDYLEQSPDFDHSMSFADYISVLNSAVNESGEPELPEDDDTARTLMLFVGADDVEHYLSEDHSRASIVVRHSLTDSKDLGRALDGLRRFIDQTIDPDLDVTITGESVLTDNAVNYLVLGQVRSLALIVVAIVIVVSLLFLTLRAGLIAAAVILLPIAILFGVMGLARIPLDSATSMIAAIAVGVGIDHLVHFMVRYHEHLRHGHHRLDSIARTIRDEAVGIGTATLALAAGFSMLAMSQFPPIYYFGLLSAMTMFSTFIATFVLAPVLLSYVPLTTLWDLLGTRLRQELIEDCPLFQQMHGLQIRRVILSGRRLCHQDGDTIMQSGDTGQSLFVLLRGEVAIESNGRQGEPVALKIARAGEVFGLAALLSKQPRIATATAIGPAEVLALNWQQLQRIARRYPRTASLLYRNLSVLIGRRFTHAQSPPFIRSYSTCIRNRT